MYLGIVEIIAGWVLMYAGMKQQSVQTALMSLLSGQSSGPTPNQFPWEQVFAGQFAKAGNIGSTLLSNGATTGDLAKLHSEAIRMANLHRPYLWGGGHAAYSPNGPWDCSGAVSELLHASGYLSGPPRVSGQFMNWGKPGPGKDFTVYANPTHVFIMFPGGVYWGTSHMFPGGGLGMKRANYPTSGFVARHMDAPDAAAAGVVGAVGGRAIPHTRTALQGQGLFG